MLSIKPKLKNAFFCPQCRARSPVVNGTYFESAYIFANCKCTSCAFAFYQVLPISHTIDYPISIGKEKGKVFSPPHTPEWLRQSLEVCHTQRKQDPVKIDRMIFTDREDVVILNTLDPIYGHVLLKLYNAADLIRQSRIGLVLIVPEIFRWLVPKGCAEVWVVDLPLQELKYGYTAINDFIQGELSRFKTVSVSKAFSHPPITDDGILLLTKTQPFQIRNFPSKLQITFVLREDRWWFSGWMDYWFYRVSRKLKALRLAAALLSRRQNTQVKKAIDFIQDAFPQASFAVAGLGRRGSFPAFVKDLRHNRTTPEIEQLWCSIYAQSHLVIGVHGSNMLLPTALAAGCIEIVPTDRLGNLVQDITVRHSSRVQLFLCRFLGQYTKPSELAATAISIIADFPIFSRNMCQNVYHPRAVTIMRNLRDGHH
jgi:hypothetical protein